VQRKILDGLKIREHALGARHLHRAEELVVSAAETPQHSLPGLIRMVTAGDLRRGGELVSNLALVAEVERVPGPPKVASSGEISVYLTDPRRFGKLPSGAPCGFRARLHQLGEALIPRGTKSSNPSPSSRESANLRFLRPPSHVERPVRVLVVREGSMVRIRARRPSWKALSEPRNSLRVAILPVWRSGCGSSTPPVHSRSRHLAGLCIRRLFGHAFTLIE
jgi:hypothetical protein